MWIILLVGEKDRVQSTELVRHRRDHDVYNV